MTREIRFKLLTCLIALAILFGVVFFGGAEYRLCGGYVEFRYD